MANSPTEMFVKGILAGWLIAALVWMLPSAEGTEIFIITLITYIIALGDFTHIIAGSVEAIYMCVIGEVGFGQAFGGFFIPTLLGNVAGGTVLFALISYAQVREELERYPVRPDTRTASGQARAPPPYSHPCPLALPKPSVPARSRAP